MRNLRGSWTALLMTLAVLAAAGAADSRAAAQQSTLQTGALLGRMSSAYRSMQSYQDTATLSHKVDDKDVTATVTLAAQRPARYLLNVQGDNLNTVVVCDGESLLAIRPDRKAYTKTRAPEHLMGADVLSKVEVPSPGARIVTLLLENGVRAPQDPLAQAMAAGSVQGPLALGDKFAYVLTFRYDEDRDARVYVTDGDYLVRRVVLVQGGRAVIDEKHDVTVDQPVSASTFAYKLPESAQLVFTLPGLPTVVASSSGPMAPDFSAIALNGRTIHLADFRGKVVVLDFWATWCGPCQRSMPHIEQVYQKVKSQDVVVLGLCVWDDQSAYEQWMPENRSKYHFNFAFDPAGKDMQNNIASKLFGVDGIPTTFVIDKEGHIAGKVVGYSANDTRVEGVLRKLGIDAGA